MSPPTIRLRRALEYAALAAIRSTPPRRVRSLDPDSPLAAVLNGLGIQIDREAFVIPATKDRLLRTGLRDLVPFEKVFWDEESWIAHPQAAWLLWCPHERPIIAWSLADV